MSQRAAGFNLSVTSAALQRWRLLRPSVMLVNLNLSEADLAIEAELLMLFPSEYREDEILSQNHPTLPIKIKISSQALGCQQREIQ